MSTWTLVAALVPTGGPAFVAGSPPSGNAIVAVRSPARMGHLASPRMALGAGAGGGDLAGGSDPERNAQLAALRSRITVNGEECAAGEGAKCPLGSPVAALAWLANHLVGRGKRLLPGDVTVEITEMTDDEICVSLTSVTQTDLQTFVGFDGGVVFEREQSIDG